MQANGSPPLAEGRGGERREPSLTGVMLMSFGTAETLDDVPAYLSSVRGGRPVPDELVAEMRRRFALVGGSPLTRITREQAAALETTLNASADDGPGHRYRVVVGMRHAPPFIADGLAELARAGARHVVALVLSPQFSPTIMGGYLRALDEAGAAHPDLTVTAAGAWHDEPAFIDALVQRAGEALARLSPDEQAGVQVFFTAHSLPRSVADGEPDYIEQLHETARLVAHRLRLPDDRWVWAYQSAGHTPEAWLTPDIKDLLPALAAAGHRRALIVPIQFLADHLEVLYDIDVAARAQAAAVGIDLIRIESLNTMDRFITALANVVHRTLSSGMPAPAPAL